MWCGGGKGEGLHIKPYDEAGGGIVWWVGRYTYYVVGWLDLYIMFCSWIAGGREIYTLHLVIGLWKDRFT